MKGLVIPLSALSVVRMSSPVEGGDELAKNVVADLGLGKDVWSIPLNNITSILQVRMYQG